MEKKTKLTISGSAKKSIKNIEIAKSQGKNSVVIEKQTGKFSSRGGSFRSSTNKPRITSTFNRGTPLKSSFNPKSPPITNDFEKRKLAEQRATRRLKGEVTPKENKSNKTNGKRRELKLTISRALSDDHAETKSRSLASLKRAKQKENRVIQKDQLIDRLKPVKREVNIPEVITIRVISRIIKVDSNSPSTCHGNTENISVTTTRELACLFGSTCKCVSFFKCPIILRFHISDTSCRSGYG